MDYYNQFNITNRVAAMLEADEQIAALVGDSIFPIDAPDGTDGSFIVYQRDGYAEQGTKTGLATRSPVVNVACVAGTYKESQQLAMRVYDVLEGIHKNPYAEMRMQDSTEEHADKKYIQILQFAITI